MTLLERLEILKKLVAAFTQLITLQAKAEKADTGDIEIRQVHTTKSYQTPLFEENMIVGHIDLGREKGTINEILNGARSASYHWYIPRHAKYVVEFVPKEKAAWHAGVLHAPDQSYGKLLGGENDWIESGEPNRYSFGICYEGRTVKTEPNQGQLELTAKLVRKKGIDHLPWIEHWRITSYKPKVTTVFVTGMRTLLGQK